MWVYLLNQLWNIVIFVGSKSSSRSSFGLRQLFSLLMSMFHNEIWHVSLIIKIQNNKKKQKVFLVLLLYFWFINICKETHIKRPFQSFYHIYFNKHLHTYVHIYRCMCLSGVVFFHSHIHTFQYCLHPSIFYSLKC